MHENNFEKQVREKMDPFGFDPPEVVWSNIDQAINPDKKRRKPLFWIFLFSGLLVLGGGYYYTKVDHKVSAAVPEVLTASKKNKADIYGDTPADQKMANHGEIEKTGHPATSNLMQVQQTAPGGNVSNASVHVQTIEAGQGRSKTSAIVSKKTSKWSGKAVAGSGAAVIGSTGTNSHPGQEVSRPEHQQVSSDSNMTVYNQSPVVVNAPVPDSSAAGKTARKNAESKQKSPWTWGLTGSAGASEISQGLFQSSNGNAAGYTSYPTANGSSGGSIAYSPSDIAGGFSYSIGAFVKRSLSERIYLSAGIDYHYYSTSIQTGQQVDSMLYLYSASLAAVQVSRYYQYGMKQSYTNQYHFIEIPVSAGFQLNKNKKNPLIWEAGFTLAYLTGSNALHFNSASGAYYQDNQQLNKTQLNAATSLMFGWPLKSGALQWGPQVEYGLTQISKSGAGNPEHLLFYGLKIYFFTGKK
jgi:hypothetical protein